MEERALLERLKKRDDTALEEAIAQYGGYVHTVVQGRGGDSLTAEDAEELAADVFFALWRRAGQVKPGRLRGWLGAVARNRTVDHLRRLGRVLPLEEDAVVVPDALWRRLQDQERTELVRGALETMDPMDREIFLRHYDWCQTMKAIAGAMGLSQPAVKMRLHRGRKQLKRYFEERGIQIEDFLS